VYKLDPVNFNIISIETYYINLDYLVDPTLFIDQMSSRLMVLYNYIFNLMSFYKPLVIFMEASFLNVKYPLAVIQLSQYISTIGLASRTANFYTKILVYPPRYVKKMMAVGGNADKNAMLASVDNIPEITKHVDVTLVTEHVVDALCIGYVGMLELRERPLYLLSV
jgi:Holliday junction resolvasome RuvABC endonuclease subunit